MLYYAMLCYAILYYTILYYTILCGLQRRLALGREAVRDAFWGGTTCLTLLRLIRPRVFCVLFVVSRSTIMCYMIRIR